MRRGWKIGCREPGGQVRRGEADVEDEADVAVGGKPSGGRNGMRKWGNGGALFILCREKAGTEKEKEQTKTESRNKKIQRPYNTNCNMQALYSEMYCFCCCFTGGQCRLPRVGAPPPGEGRGQ